ncbi:MAG: sugar kinase [Chloroflexota bacterium]|nr:sugar kinase [Chloroflexota bacterium]MDE3101227.1 sugar kinase [Chloroflexota bacterium]
MPEILVVGSVAYDDVQTPFDRRRDLLGGAASYFALAASRYAPVHVVAVVGEDFREGDIERLRAEGIDVAGIERRPGRSFRWHGRYDYDMSAAETLNTDLGVFADWHPVVPDGKRDVPYVFLANIDPDIQLDLLDQVGRPQLIAMDSMNYWLEFKRDAVATVMSRADVVCINEGEARQFAQTFSIIRAAREILDLGPTALVVKRGEHGAMLFLHDGGVFWSPAYPLEKVQDPTGAGDSFAGGFVGHLAAVGRTDPVELRRAVVHGTVSASFAVETFSVDGVARATPEAVDERYRLLRSLVDIGAGVVGDTGSRSE